MAFLNILHSIKPIFRNPDKLQVLPFREWIRLNLPSGPEGFSAEDLDLVIRVHGPRNDSDVTGKFMLIELKFQDRGLTWSQKYTFKLIDKLLRKADPQHERYKGFFLINYTNENWDRADFKVNDEMVSRDKLLEFLNFILDLESYDF